MLGVPSLQIRRKDRPRCGAVNRNGGSVVAPSPGDPYSSPLLPTGHPQNIEKDCGPAGIASAVPYTHYRSRRPACVVQRRFRRRGQLSDRHRGRTMPNRRCWQPGSCRGAVLSEGSRPRRERRPGVADLPRARRGIRGRTCSGDLAAARLVPFQTTFRASLQSSQSSASTSLDLVPVQVCRPAGRIEARTRVGEPSSSHSCAGKPAMARTPAWLRRRYSAPSWP